MSCALTNNANYPDYLKSILKEISLGNDKRLKDCACSLTIPRTDEGCAILDEDDKLGAFPFCVPKSSQVGDNTFYPLKLTLKEAMAFYWLTKNSSVSAKIRTGWTDPWFSCPGIDCETGSITWLETISSLIFTFNGLPYKANKDKVCPGSFGVGADVSRVNVAHSCPSCSEVCLPWAPDKGQIQIASAFESPFIDWDLKSGPKIVMNKEGENYYFYPYFNLVFMSYGGAITTNLPQVQAHLPCSYGCETETRTLSISFPGFTKNLNYYYKKYKDYNPLQYHQHMADQLDFDCGDVIRLGNIQELKLDFS